MHISFAGKKIRLLALAVTIFMIIFVSANWRLYLDPTLDLQGGTILFVLSLLAGPTAGFLIIFKPSVDQKYQAFANTALSGSDTGSDMWDHSVCSVSSGRTGCWISHYIQTIRG